MEWLTPPVAQVVKVIKGKRPTHVENFPSETAPLPYITIEAFESGSPSQFASARNGEVITEDGDVLIVWDGARFGLVGLSPGGVLGSTLAKLKPLPMLDRKYLYYFLQTQYAYLRSVHRGSGIPHIDASHLGRCRIPLPPLSEQRRIVEILDQADRLRRLRAEADAKADRILPVLFIKMFGDPAPSAKRIRLNELVAIGGALVDPDRREYYDLPHIGGENIEKSSGRIINVKSVRASRLRSGKFYFTERHVLYSKIRPYLNKVAFPRMKGLCSADIYPLLPIDRRLGPWFLTALLRSDEFVAYASRLSDRLRMPKLNQEQLGAFEISLPNPRAVRAFESRAESIAALDDKRMHTARRMNELFACLMVRAFNGSLTASWREAHRKELLQEIEQQAKVLEGASG